MRRRSRRKPNRGPRSRVRPLQSRFSFGDSIRFPYFFRDRRPLAGSADHHNRRVHHQSSESFILATYPLREKDRIVSFLTRDAGKKRGVARGARSPRSHFSGALEPMTEARVVFYEKEGRDLVSINEVEPIRPSFALSGDLGRALLLSALAESLEVFVSDSDPA